MYLFTIGTDWRPTWSSCYAHVYHFTRLWSYSHKFLLLGSYTSMQVPALLESLVYSAMPTIGNQPALAPNQGRHTKTIFLTLVGISTRMCFWWFIIAHNKITECQNELILPGSPINEKIIDDHLAVQAIIRSYQVKYVSYYRTLLKFIIVCTFCLPHYANPADVLLFVFPWIG